MLKNIFVRLIMVCIFCKSPSLVASVLTPLFGGVDAIIFDCDGVLVDTEHLKFLAWQQALATLDIELSIQEYKAVAGHSSKKIVEMLEQAKGISIPEKVILLRRSEYQKLQECGIHPIEETVNFASYLSQNKNALGIKLGLASSASKSEILLNLKQIGLEQAFDLIISGSDDLENYVDLEGKNKPKPYIYLEASKKLNIPPDRCLVIEDSGAGVEAASKAGMITVAIPNKITAGQDFSKSNMVLDSISELSLQITSISATVPFKNDDDLERNPNTSVQKCLQNFLCKGGILKCIPNLESNKQQIQINLGDAVYPVCSGGWCRSQALWAILQPFSDKIILFPPHAARVGWDPYNGQINRYKNYAQEIVYDEFESFFGTEKVLRFGFEHDTEWKSIEKSPTNEGLGQISQFYDQHYFGAGSSWQGRQGKKRIYITFSNNAHVTIYRLNQNNESLEAVTVVAIDSEDLITYPPPTLNTTARSIQAYEYFGTLLKGVFDVRELDPTGFN